MRSKAGRVGGRAVTRRPSAAGPPELFDVNRLREAEDRFRGAFDSAAIGMALVAPDGRWLQVNSAVCELVGFSEDELLGGTFQGITHPDDLDADLEFVRQMLAGAIQTYQMDKRYIHKLGHTIWIRLSVSLVRDPAGAPAYFVSLIQDISQQRYAEELADQLRHSQKLDAIGRLAGGVAHDFNNMLTAIKGYGQLLLDGLEANDPLRGFTTSRDHDHGNLRVCPDLPQNFKTTETW